MIGRHDTFGVEEAFIGRFVMKGEIRYNDEGLYQRKIWEKYFLFFLFYAKNRFHFLQLHGDGI